MRIAFLLCAAAAFACKGSFGTPPYAAVQTGGNPDRGGEVIRARRCGACHVIPGIRGAHGVVAPPLARLAAKNR